THDRGRRDSSAERTEDDRATHGRRARRRSGRLHGGSAARLERLVHDRDGDQDAVRRARLSARAGGGTRRSADGQTDPKAGQNGSQDPQAAAAETTEINQNPAPYHQAALGAQTAGAQHSEVAAQFRTTSPAARRASVWRAFPVPVPAAVRTLAPATRASRW